MQNEEVEIINTDFSFLENHDFDCPNAQTSSCVIASITPELAAQIAEMHEPGIRLRKQMPKWDKRPRIFEGLKRMDFGGLRVYDNSIP